MKLSTQHASHSQEHDTFRLRMKPIAVIAFSMMACAAIPQAVAEAVVSAQTQTGAVDEVSFDNIYLRGTEAARSTPVVSRAVTQCRREPIRSICW